MLDLLHETGILVVHGSGFGMDPQAGCFRLVYLAGQTILDEVFGTLGEFLASYEPAKALRSADLKPRLIGHVAASRSVPSGRTGSQRGVLVQHRVATARGTERLTASAWSRRR